MNEFLEKIKKCERCSLFKLEMNIDNINKGYGKLLPFYLNDYHNKIMLCGLNPSYRRFPNIYQAFGGQIEHNGTGYDFIKLLEELDLLNEIYVTNLVKCSTLNNKINTEIMKKCFSIFLKEIVTVNPSKIIALGRQVHSFLKDNLNYNIMYLPHPCYWSAYKRITKEEYSKLLWNAITL